MGKNIEVVALVVLLLVLKQFAYGQASNDSILLSFEANSCRVNDEMQVVEVEKPEELWNLSQMKVLKKKNLKVKQYQSDTLALIFNGARTYLLQAKDKVLLLGKESPLSIISYIMPERLLTFPFSSKDSISGYFIGEGKYCDKVSVREFGKYQTKMLRQAALTLPNDEILHDTYVLQTTRDYQSLYFPIDTVKEKLLMLSTDSVVKYLKETRNVIKEQTRRIYAKGYRYPIVELIEQRNADNHLLSQHCYYISPETQEIFLGDACNEKIRNKIRNNENATREDLGLASPSLDKPYQFYYDGESDRGILRKLQENEVFSLIVSDVRGMVYKRQVVNKSNTSVSVDCSGLPTNQYVMLIKFGGATYVEKFKKD